MSQGLRGDDNLLMSISDFFSESPCLYNPQHCTWVTSQNCVWKGPDFLSSKTVLGRSYANEDHLEDFFKTILGIGSATVETIIEELCFQRAKNDVSTEQLELCRKAYAYIDSHTHSDKDCENLR